MNKNINNIKELDFEDSEVILKLATFYKQWCEKNKYYDFKFMVVNISNAFQTNDVIIINNLWKESNAPYTVHNGEEFIDDLEYLLSDWLECRDYNKEDTEYFDNFWEEKVNYLTSLSSPFLNG